MQKPLFFDDINGQHHSFPGFILFESSLNNIIQGKYSGKQHISPIFGFLYFFKLSGPVRKRKIYSTEKAHILKWTGAVK